MRAIKLAKFLIVPLFVLSLALSGAARAPGARAIPPPAVQGQSFSVAQGGPLSRTGVHPADILGIGGLPLIPCENLGLLCADPAGVADDDINGLSFGYDFYAMGLPPLQFSVDGRSRGAAGTAVEVESKCSPSEPQADAFETAFHGSNTQDLDGDGVPCGANAGYGLMLTEGADPDDVDALERDPCLFADLNCDGTPENPIYLVLAPGSTTLGMIGATTADILMTGVGYGPFVWASAAELGLVTGEESDVIDALCIQESGNGVYDAGDRVAFSLAPGSPTLASLSASPAAILRPDPPRVAVAESALGLGAHDNVDALVCTSALLVSEVFLPLVMK